MIKEPFEFSSESEEDKGLKQSMTTQPIPEPWILELLILEPEPEILEPAIQEQEHNQLETPLL